MKNVVTRSLFFSAAVLVGFTACQSNDDSDVITEAAIIPQPVSVTTTGERFTINDRTTIYVTDEKAMGVASYLSSMLSAASVFEVPIEVSTETKTKRSIVLELQEGGDDEEAYGLDISSEGIVIRSSSPHGLFYGVQTLRQLLPPAIEGGNEKRSGWEVPTVTIRDEPVYKWRGMHLDVSRHFFSVAFVKQFIDRLALYKFNTLHLHLTDDQGWRIQINKYPQLTDVGAWRIPNNQDSVCLERAVTNPDFELPQEFFREQDGVRQYGGYYSQDDIREIVRYASERFITIVPEIDMPGHMNAAISLFPQLTCVDEGGWGKLFTIPLCPCEETTYEFINDVISEVAALFPGEYLHIGADEVDERTWSQYGPCRELIRSKGLESAGGLHSYFVNRVNTIVQQHGKKAIGWDEIIDGKVDSSITVMYWRGWVADAPARALRGGHDLIMSPTSCCYFDYAPDATTLEKLYAFDPVPSGTSEKERQKILGVQANIWTEYIPTPARLDYMTMPRMTALAEVAWSPSREWQDYSSRVSGHYPRWDVMNVRYRLPDIPNIPGQVAFIDSTQFSLEIPEGIAEVRYTTDGTEPDINASLYTSPFSIQSSTTIKLLTLGYEQRAGNRYTVRLEKQQYRSPVTSLDSVTGLTCHYYEGAYSAVSRIAARDKKQEAIVREVGIPSFTRANVFALEFEGLLQIPEDGIYTFYLSSDDGSVLYVGDQLVVDNDGLHGEREVAAQVALAKGFHPITLRYFDGGGGNTLRLEYEGPGIKRQEIPRQALRVK